MNKTRKIIGCINCPYAKKSEVGEWLCQYADMAITINFITNERWHCFPIDCPLPEKRRKLPKSFEND